MWETRTFVRVKAVLAFKLAFFKSRKNGLINHTEACNTPPISGFWKEEIVEKEVEFLVEAIFFP